MVNELSKTGMFWNGSNNCLNIKKLNWGNIYSGNKNKIKVLMILTIALENKFSQKSLEKSALNLAYSAKVKTRTSWKNLFIWEKHKIQWTATYEGKHIALKLTGKKAKSLKKVKNIRNYNFKES